MYGVSASDTTYFLIKHTLTSRIQKKNCDDPSPCRGRADFSRKKSEVTTWLELCSGSSGFPSRAPSWWFTQIGLFLVEPVGQSTKRLVSLGYPGTAYKASETLALTRLALRVALPDLRMFSGPNTLYSDDRTLGCTITASS